MRSGRPDIGWEKVAEERRGRWSAMRHNTAGWFFLFCVTYLSALFLFNRIKYTQMALLISVT